MRNLRHSWRSPREYLLLPFVALCFPFGCTSAPNSTEPDVAATSKPPPNTRSDPTLASRTQDHRASPGDSPSSHQEDSTQSVITTSAPGSATTPPQREVAPRWDTPPEVLAMQASAAHALVADAPALPGADAGVVLPEGGAPPGTKIDMPLPDMHVTPPTPIIFAPPAAPNSICTRDLLNDQLLCSTDYPNSYKCPFTSSPTGCINTSALSLAGTKEVCCQ